MTRYYKIDGYIGTFRIVLDADEHGRVLVRSDREQMLHVPQEWLEEAC